MVPFKLTLEIDKVFFFFFAFQARKERLLKMQQKDQENGVTPKKHWKATLAQGVDDASSPSVASRSAAFETKTKDEQKVSTAL